MRNYNYIKYWLSINLSKSKYEHSLSVAILAKTLALRYTFPPEKAYLAGLLHDCGYAISPFLWKSISNKYGISYTHDEKEIPALQHAIVSTVLTRYLFNIDDKDILLAIRNHSTGRPRLSGMERILFIADYTEPLRKTENRDILRTQAFSDIEKSMRNVVINKIAYLKYKRFKIAKQTLDLEEFIKNEEITDER